MNRKVQSAKVINHTTFFYNDQYVTTVTYILLYSDGTTRTTSVTSTSPSTSGWYADLEKEIVAISNDETKELSEQFLTDFTASDFTSTADD